MRRSRISEQNEEMSAIAKLRAEQKAKRKKRSCLFCHHDFMSEGAHNRICNPCKKANHANSRGMDMIGPNTGHRIESRRNK